MVLGVLSINTFTVVLLGGSISKLQLPSSKILSSNVSLPAKLPWWRKFVEFRQLQQGCALKEVAGRCR